MKFLIIVILFFVLSALFIISNNKLALYEKENVEKFSELYIDWINQVYENSQTITGYAVKMNWLPQDGA